MSTAPPQPPPEPAPQPADKPAGDPTCRRRLHFSSLAEAASDARELQDGYLRCGRWSLAQVCDHLSLFMTYSIEGFPGRRLPGPIGFALRTMLLNDWMMRRPMPSGMPAPDYLQPPETETAVVGGTYEAATEADAEAAARFRDACLLVTTHEDDWRPSPLFGKLSPERWRRVHLKHAEHHLGFLVPTSAERLDAHARSRGA